jgi:hypothetical protein
MHDNQNNQTERRGGKRAKAGRPRGAKSRINAGVREVVNAVFNRHDPIRTAILLIDKGIETGELRVVYGVWRDLMMFMYGKPAERIEITGDIQHTMTTEEREQSRKVLEKLLPEPIEVKAREIN